MENIDFNISNEYEETAVGMVTYTNNDYYVAYSEESMLRAYKENWLSQITNIKEYNIFPNDEKIRHGLQYELIKAQYEALGLEYTKLDYIYNYVNNNDNRENDNNFELDLVR